MILNASSALFQFVDDTSHNIYPSDLSEIIFDGGRFYFKPSSLYRHQPIFNVLYSDITSYNGGSVPTSSALETALNGFVGVSKDVATEATLETLLKATDTLSAIDTIASVATVDTITNPITITGAVEEGGQGKTVVANPNAEGLLNAILKELKIMNLHLSLITDEIIEKTD